MKKVLCLVLILIFAISVTVYATPIKPDVPYSCSCGGTNVYTGSSYGEWVFTSSQRTCLHGNGGYDIRCYRDVIDFYECSNCSNSTQVSYREVEWICGSELLP